MSEKKDSLRDLFTKYQKSPDIYKEDLLAKVTSYHESWKTERGLKYDQQWRMNLEFYRGNQYVRDVGQGAGAPYRVRLKENHTNNAIQRMVSIFVQNIPIARVFPNSTDNSDIQNAQASEEWLKYVSRKEQIDNHYSKLVKYTSIMGPGFITVDWNADKGEYLELDVEEEQAQELSDEPLTDNGLDQETFEKPKRKKKVYKGDYQIKVDDPFKIVVRPGIDSWCDMYDYFRSEIVSRDALESKYGDISPDAPSPTMYNPTYRYGKNDKVDSDAVLINHYYHKPTEWFEGGLYVCWTGKQLLKACEFIYEDGEFPTEYLGFDIPPASFYGIASIEQVMDLQEQLNKAASMIIEARNLIARPRVFASHQSKIPAQSLSDRPGEIVRFDAAGGPPLFVTPSFNFGELATHKADVRGAMNAIMGMSSASRGEIPANVKTALALQLVLEQDRSQFLPFIKNFYNVILKVNQKILARAAQYVPEDDPRALKVDKYGSSTLFSGACVPQPLDIYLEDTNPLGWTAASRQENVAELVKMGLIEDKTKALEMIGLHDADPAFEDFRISKQAAQLEIQRMNRGELVDIGPRDLDEIHLAEHYKVVRSPSWDMMHPIKKEIHLKHIEDHENRIQRMGQPQDEVPGVPGGPAAGVPGPGLPKAIAPEELANQTQLDVPGQNIQNLLSEPSRM